MKKILITFLLMFTFIQPSLGAGSSGDGSGSKTDYEKALKFVKQAKKYDNKGKTDKAAISPIIIALSAAKIISINIICVIITSSSTKVLY